MRVQSVSAPSGASFVVPRDGFVQKASTFGTSASSGSAFTFLAWRPTGTSFTLIGKSDRLVLRGVNAVAQFTFSNGPVNVLAGDLLGIYTEGGPCVAGATGYRINQRAQGTSPQNGYVLPPGDSNTVILNVAAVLTYPIS